MGWRVGWRGGSGCSVRVLDPEHCPAQDGHLLREQAGEGMEDCTEGVDTALHPQQLLVTALEGQAGERPRVTWPSPEGHITSAIATCRGKPQFQA